MRSKQIFKNFYFYLRFNYRQIKTQLKERDSPRGKRWHSHFYSFLRKLGMAALITMVVYELFFYLNLGRFLSFSEFLAEPFLQLEMLLGFFFVFTMLLIFPVISTLVTRKFQNGDPVLKTGVEVLLVVLSSTFFLSLLNYGPLYLLTGIEASPGRLRTGYLVTAIFSLFFYFFVERERSKKHLQAEMLRSSRLQKENFEAELQNLKNQVSPHFLFNSLNVLASLIPLDQNKAVEFTSRLSDLYRLLLENSVLQLISLRKELRVAEAYIFLLETRFGEAVKFHLDVSSKKLGHLIPPGALQLLLENAIKHNGSTRKKPLHIRVFSEADKLVVANNLQPRKEKITSTEKGLENIKSRYRYFTDEPVEIGENASEFIVKIPLLKESAYDDLNY